MEGEDVDDDGAQDEQAGIARAWQQVM